MDSKFVRLLFARMAALVILFVSLLVSDVAFALALDFGFIQNKGQYRSDIAYVYQGQHPLWVSQQGALHYGTVDNSLTETLITDAALDFEPQASKFSVSYDKANSASISTTGSSSLLIQQAWSNISVEMTPNAGAIEKTFVVGINADPTIIQLKTNGELTLSENGSLIANFNQRSYNFSIPHAWQLDEKGQKLAIDVRYDIKSKSVYGFKLGRYDRSKTLWIDPVVKSTELNADDNITVSGIASDPDTGEVFVVGSSNAKKFPIDNVNTASNNSGNSQIFLARFSSDLIDLKGVTFFANPNVTAQDPVTLKYEPIKKRIYILIRGLKDLREYDSSLNLLSDSIMVSTFVSTGSIQYQNFALDANNDTLYAVGAINKSAADDLSAFSVGTLQDKMIDQAGKFDVFVFSYKKDPGCTSNCSFKPNKLTFLGGNDLDWVTDAAFSAESKSVYVVGYTRSQLFSGIPTGNPDGVGHTAYVVKINADLTGSVIGDVFDANSSGYDHIVLNNGHLDLLGKADASFGRKFFLVRYDLQLQNSQIKSTGVGISTDIDFVDLNESALMAHPVTHELFFAGVGTVPGLTAPTQEKFCGTNGCSGRDVYVARYSEDLTQLKHEIQWGGEAEETHLALHVATTNQMYVAADSSSKLLPPFDTVIGNSVASVSSAVIAEFNGLSVVTDLKADDVNLAPRKDMPLS